MNDRWSNFDLTEYRRQIRRTECARYGHSFDVLHSADGTPRQVQCARCGDTWDVVG